jgi:hypothetical protein
VKRIRNERSGRIAWSKKDRARLLIYTPLVTHPNAQQLNLIVCGFLENLIFSSMTISGFIKNCNNQ